MFEHVDRLMEDVFVRDEACRAELRLSPDEAHHAACRWSVSLSPLSEQPDKDGKRWYLVSASF